MQEIEVRKKESKSGINMLACICISLKLINRGRELSSYKLMTRMFSALKSLIRHVEKGFLKHPQIFA